MHPHPVEDVLESVLNVCRTRVGAPAACGCGGSQTDRPVAVRRHFHLIGTQECMLLGATPEEATRLHCGDLVVVLSDARHTLVTANDAPAAVPGEGAAMLYGEFDLPMGPASTLLRALPGCLIVRSREASPYFGQLVSILRAVVRDTRPGQQILINNLASTILALAVCEYAYRVPGAGEAFAALLDVRIVRVLRAIHERPGENWNIRTLAALAGMSRSTFAQHFLAIIGMPPMRYVTSWRIGRAKELLQDHCLSVAQVAEMLGYGSEAAFRKLFKRVAGMGPGQARADARRKPASQADAALDETTY